VKNPVEFRPRPIAIHVNRHVLGRKIAYREHAPHYVLKDMLLDGIELAGAKRRQRYQRPTPAVPAPTP